jgi:hypothetical protein
MKDTILIEKRVVSKNAYFDVHTCEFEVAIVHGSDYFEQYASDTVYFINHTKGNIVLNGCYFFEDIRPILKDSIISAIFETDSINYTDID